MRKLKLFDSFQETEYKKFGGIDITDVDSISFSWSNVPYFSDYYDHKGELGDPYIRIGMTKYLKQSLSEIDVIEDWPFNGYKIVKSINLPELGI